jgi:hypothetical protein
MGRLFLEFKQHPEFVKINLQLLSEKKWSMVALHLI